MKFLFASDSFKGTLSSEQISNLLAKAAEDVFPDCEYDSIAVADGGEGTVDAVIAAAGGEKIGLKIHGPLWEERQCFYGKLDDTRAILEMAQASGLPLVPWEKRDPRYTTSYGTGEMIQDALKKGFTDITIAIGGSATNDGGMGCMTALGVRFLDETGRELKGCGADLERVRDLDLSGLDPRIYSCRFTVMCDVTNPLCGENGATYTYGKQKGGTPEILEKLEAGMCSYRRLLLKKFGMDADKIKGAGAAGGLGAALMIFLGAALKPGIETVLDLVEFDRRLEDVSLVITGEGSADRQSLLGKVVQGIGMRCQARHIPVIAIVGNMGEGAERLYEYGIDSVMTTINAAMPLSEAMERAEELYLNAAERTFRMLRTGWQLSSRQIRE